MTKYIIISFLDQGWEQVANTEEYDAPFQAYPKIQELEKKYGKRMNFQVCKIYKD